MSPPRDPFLREAAFRDLYEATYDDLLRFAQRRVHRSHAEDVVADTMLVAWRRFGDAPPDPGDARAWLFGIARHTLLNAHRGDRRRIALAVRIADVGWSPVLGDDTEMAARTLDLAQAWQRLSSVHQEALALTVWDGLTSAQAAQALGISPVAYRLRLSRARRALRAHLDHLPAPAGHSRGGISEWSPS